MTSLKDSISDYAHELYFQRGRIIRRLSRASAKGLARFADMIEVLSDEDLDALALEGERMALERMKKSQPNENGEKEENEEVVSLKDDDICGL